MKLDVRAIRARADAADKGPWRAENDQFSDVEHRRRAVALWSEKHDPKNRLWVVESPTMASALIGGERSARFIAAARTDVPALCDRVEALEAALREALSLYTDTDAESAEGYARYRKACAVLEGA